MKIKSLVFNQYFILSLILILGFMTRLYKIDIPVADWHSWRQADTAAVSRNFFKESFTPFIPKYDDMSSVSETLVPNPNRYRFVEFPIYNSIVYFFYLLNGQVDERLARLVSVIFSLGSTVFVFLITKNVWGKFSGLLSAFVFALLPFNIYFSRVILPEPSLVFFCLGMFYFTNMWIYKNTKTLFMVAVFFAICAFLTKPSAIFYLLPLIYSYRVKERKWWPIPSRYIIFLILVSIPFLSWRLWMMQFPEGIPANKWLFNGDGIRFKPSFWKWILGDRFGREILSVAGTVLFFIGFLVKPHTKNLLLHLLLFSSFLFLITIASGNVRHDYYQTLIIPALAIFTARGFIILVAGFDRFIPRIFTMPLGFLLLFLTFYLSWAEVKGFYQINNSSIVEAGRAADSLLPKNAVVVAPYNGDTAFLYQTNRAGWPVVTFPMTELIKSYGVEYYISINYDAKTNWVLRNYEELFKTPNYVIVDLTKPIPRASIIDPEPE